jgi:hypothetical protein
MAGIRIGFQCGASVSREVSKFDLQAPLFQRVDPNMKFIHIVRHPGAVVASMLRGVDSGLMKKADYVDSVLRLSVSDRLGFDGQALAHESYEKWSFVWMAQNEKAFEEMRDSASYLLISYEALCLDMSRILGDICEFLELESISKCAVS